MYPFLRHRNTDLEAGFSLMEVMVAIVILTIGLMSAALLMANVYKSTVRSRYMALATQLASEELEDLNRWPVTTSQLNGATVVTPDFHIMVPSGSYTCGSPGGLPGIGCLTQDWGPNIFQDSLGNSVPVSYFDSVYLTTQNGQMSETYQNPNASSASYNTLTFYPNGQPPSVSTTSTPPTTGMTFDRRWVIEQDQPVVGVRRITVLVTLDDQTITPPVTFQMSMVRP